MPRYLSLYPLGNTDIYNLDLDSVTYLTFIQSEQKTFIFQFSKTTQQTFVMY